MSYVKVMFRYRLASPRFFSKLTSHTLASPKRIFTFNEGVIPPLHMAVYEGRLERVKQLIHAGADVNYKAENRLTPLHAALFGGQVECTKLLINSGADVKSNQKDEITPLHLGSFYGHYKCVKLLVNAGADVNSTDQDGNTPLMWAAHDEVDKFRQSSEICMEVLLYAGAKINIINKDNENAVQAHIRYKSSENKQYNARICQVLIAAGETESCNGLDYAEIMLKSSDFVDIMQKEFRGSLKNGVREKIRQHLLKQDRHGNLFHRVQKLGLPSWFERYLVFNVRLLDRSDYVLDSDYNR